VIALAAVSKFNLNFLRAMVSDGIRLASELAGLSARCCSKGAEDLWTERRVEAGLPHPARRWGGGISPHSPGPYPLRQAFFTTLPAYRCL